MTGPLDSVTAIHNALRRDMADIDAAALGAARGARELSETVERYRFLNEVLVWHGQGEELAIFPAVDGVAPLVAEAYERDHRGLDAAFEALDLAASAGDALATARAAAAFKFHLDLHLDKEDAHLYRIVRDRISPSDQGRAAGIMAGTVPRERFPEVVAWWFPLIDHDDRENLVRTWKMAMPAEAFTRAKGLVQKAVGDDWSELCRRIPELET